MDVPETHTGGKPDLFSKVGPLPAWAWGAIVVAAYLVYRRVSAARTPYAAVDNTTQDAASPLSDSWDSGGSGGDGAGMLGSSASYNYADALGGNYTGTTTGAVFDTNQQWAVYAVNNLPKLGYSASDVVSAITFYLAGLPLTPGQVSIINAAIGNYGSPPLPMPAVPVPGIVPTPVTDPAVALPPADVAVNDPVAVAPPTLIPAPTPVPEPVAVVNPYPWMAPTPPDQYQTPTNVLPSYGGTEISSDYYTGSQPGAILGIPSGARALDTLDEKSQQTVLNGGTIYSGGVIPMKLQPGTNYLVPV